MSKIAKPFIPWVGGKEKLAPYVRQVLPSSPKAYIEPFGGSGAILLGLPASKIRIDVYNDFNADLVNLFLCVRDHSMTLMKELEYLPFHSRAEFEFTKAMLRREKSLQAYLDRLDMEIETVETCLPQDQAEELAEILKGQAELYCVKRAAAFFRLGRGSFNGTFSSFAIKPVDIRAFFKLIADASERLQGVVIENKDAVQLVQDMDDPGTIFYCDPPYYQAEQHYDVEFTKQDHIRLHDALNQCSGNVIVSYNNCDYIRDLYRDFYILAFSRPNSMSHKAGSQYLEIIMTNYDPRVFIPQMNLFEQSGSWGDMELVHIPEKPLKTI